VTKQQDLTAVEALRRARVFVGESGFGFEPSPEAQRGPSWYVFEFLHPDVLAGRVNPLEMPGAGQFIIVPDDPAEPVIAQPTPTGHYFSRLSEVRVTEDGLANRA
jgi:hypothetical protein